MDFLKTLPISLFDLVLIVFGVFSILFGLVGKAPRKIFRLVFIILALVAAYFVNKFVGPTIKEVLTSLDAVKSAIAEIDKINPALTDTLLDSVLFWVIGIVCLIIVPMIGNLIVKIATHKSKKGTAKFTFGIPSLLSTAIIWCFLLLPVILLKPLITQDTINAVVKLMAASGNSSTTTPTAATENDAKIITLSSGNVVVLDGDATQSTGNSEVDELLNNEWVQLGIKTVTESQFLTFTSEKGVPFVEQTITQVSGKNFEFLGVDDGTGNKIGIVNLVNDVVQVAVKNQDLIELFLVKDANGNLDYDAILAKIRAMDADDFKVLLKSIANAGSIVKNILNDLLVDVQGITADDIINILKNDDFVNAFVTLVKEDVIVQQVAMYAVSGKTDQIINAFLPTDTTTDEQFATLKTNVKKTLNTVFALVQSLNLGQLVGSFIDSTGNFDLTPVLSKLTEKDTNGSTLADKIVDLVYTDLVLDVIDKVITKDTANIISLVLPQEGATADSIATLKTNVGTTLNAAFNVVAGIPGAGKLVGKLIDKTGNVDLTSTFTALVAKDANQKTVADKLVDLVYTNEVLTLIASVKTNGTTALMSALTDDTTLTTIISGVTGIVSSFPGLPTLIDTLAPNKGYGNLVTLLTNADEQAYLATLAQALDFTKVMGGDLNNAVKLDFLCDNTVSGTVDNPVITVNSAKSDNIKAFLKLCVESKLVPAILTLAGMGDKAGSIPMLPILVVQGVASFDTDQKIGAAVVAQATALKNGATSDDVKAVYDVILDAVTPDSTVSKLLTGALAGDVTEVVGDLFKDTEHLADALQDVASLVEAVPAVGDMLGEGVAEVVSQLANEEVAQQVATIASVVNVGDFLSGDDTLMTEIGNGDYSGLVNETTLDNMTTEQQATLVGALVESPLVDNLLAAFTEPTEETEGPSMSTVIAAELVKSAGDDVKDIISNFASAEGGKDEATQAKYAELLRLING